MTPLAQEMLAKARAEGEVRTSSYARRQAARELVKAGLLKETGNLDDVYFYAPV